MTQDTPATSPPPGAQETRGEPTASKAIAMVLKASPGLWARVCARESLAVARRAAYKSSLVWLLSKQGFQVQEGYPASYYTEAGVVQGKVDICVLVQGLPVLAIEVDFRLAKHSAWKLLGLKKRGVDVLLMAGFTESRVAARSKIDVNFSKPTAAWLNLGLVHA